MDSYYGPIKVRVDTTTDNFTRARALDANGPATEGSHAIEPNGVLGILMNPMNFTPKAIRERRTHRERCKPDQFVEKTKIFNFTDKMGDFKSFSKDDRGLGAGGWLYNNTIDDEINRQRDRCGSLDVFILNVWQGILAADERVEYAQTFEIPNAMLSKRFWVFPQGNAQPYIRPSDFQLTVNTEEGEDGAHLSFSTSSDAIESDIKGFLAQIRELLRDSEGDGDIWWTTTDIVTDPGNGRRNKYALPGDEFEGHDFLPWLSVIQQSTNRQIWVGSTGSDYSRPLRLAKSIRASRGNVHWWVTIIDSAAGQSYMHDSMATGYSQAKAATLVDNINWLLKTGPKLSKKITNIRTSRAAPATPIGPPIRCRTKQQNNSSDCGLFTLGNITGFVDILEKAKEEPGRNLDKICATNLIPQGWSAAQLRKSLRNAEVPVSLIDKSLFLPLGLE